MPGQPELKSNTLPKKGGRGEVEEEAVVVEREIEENGSFNKRLERTVSHKSRFNRGLR